MSSIFVRQILTRILLSSAPEILFIFLFFIVLSSMILSNLYSVLDHCFQFQILIQQYHMSLFTCFQRSVVFFHTKASGRIYSRAGHGCFQRKLHLFNNCTHTSRPPKVYWPSGIPVALMLSLIRIILSAPII